MTALVIDDEPLAREILLTYLKDTPIKVVGEAENGFEALKLIQENTPELLFLDVQMPKINGFELLELLPEEKRPHIIFTTAYDTYALKAFEENAIDYLLKPFTKDRLVKALEKIREGKSKKITQSLPHRESENRIVIKDHRGIHVIPLEKVCYLSAQDDYVEVVTEKEKYLKNQRLKYYEDMLDSSQYVRVHRQFIINIHMLLKLEKYGKESFLAQMKNGDTVKISATGYTTLRQYLDI